MISVLPLLIVFLPLTIAIPFEKHGISGTVFDNLVRFTKFASAAYQPSCPRPLGNTLALQFSNNVTSTQGFVAVDHTNKQIVVSTRGTLELQDLLIDADVRLTRLVSPGVSGGSARVHAGFLSAWNSVANQVISTVKSQLDAHPNYQIVTTGHSLGGSLSSLAGLSMKSNFPNNNVQLYTFGQPRTGDATYASLVDNTLGVNNIFRAVHTIDIAPTLFPRLIGYKHHSTEYWNFADPATPATTKQCAGDEDPACSYPVSPITLISAHYTYFNQFVTTDPTVCQ